MHAVALWSDFHNDNYHTIKVSTQNNLKPYSKIVTIATIEKSLMSFVRIYCTAGIFKGSNFQGWMNFALDKNFVIKLLIFSSCFAIHT